MGVTSFLLLSCLGLTITARDCSRPVERSSMSLEGDHPLSQSFPDGTRVSFACDFGFVSARGSPVITCTAGRWSRLTLRCKRRDCGHAGEVPNGHVDYSEGTEFGDKIVISCNDGYKLVPAKSKISCGAQGWEDRLPECEAMICNPPPAVTFGTFSPDKETYEYGEVVQFTCQKDYALDGSNSTTCSDDGTFQPDPPTCIRMTSSATATTTAATTTTAPLYPTKTSKTTPGSISPPGIHGRRSSVSQLIVIVIGALFFVVISNVYLNWRYVKKGPLGHHEQGATKDAETEFFIRQWTTKHTNSSQMNNDVMSQA